MPAEDNSASLIIAHSVFTHTTQEQTEFYLRECRRVLRDDGIMDCTWFLFEKRFFPMMQDFQNALYINWQDPTNATIFDRTWLEQSLSASGLGIVSAVPPEVRGFQWFLGVRPLSSGVPPISLPEDSAPFGSMPPPVPMTDPSKIGLQETVFAESESLAQVVHEDTTEPAEETAALRDEINLLNDRNHAHEKALRHAKRYPWKYLKAAFKNRSRT